MSRVLILGASGFVGRHLALALLAEGHQVRCVSREVTRLEDLAKHGCEIASADMTDPASLQQAMKSVEAVYVSVHTLSRQDSRTTGQDFMELELTGLRNIVDACHAEGTRRLVYLTFLGVSPDAPSAWVRGRWKAEQMLLQSGLDVTVIRPGQIVGSGGRGFEMMMGQARRPIALTMGNGGSKWRNIALDDLLYYLCGVREDPRSYGKCYDVGCDDVLTNNQMIDIAAEAVSRRPPTRIGLPVSLLKPLTPLIERLARLPQGAIRGILDSLKMDAVGDPLPIRSILPRPPLSYRESVRKALKR